MYIHIYMIILYKINYENCGTAVIAIPEHFYIIMLIVIIFKGFLLIILKT